MDPTIKDLPKILLQLQVPHLFNFPHISSENDLERHFKKWLNKPSHYEHLEKLSRKDVVAQFRWAMAAQDALQERKEKKSIEEPCSKVPGSLKEGQAMAVDVPVKTSSDVLPAVKLVYSSAEIRGWNFSPHQAVQPSTSSFVPHATSSLT